MKKKNQIPTFLGILILICGIIFGVYAINSRQNYKLSAVGDLTPQNVTISNLTASSLSISWTTEKEALSFIKWGENPQALKQIAKNNNSNKSYVHHITIDGLKPSSDIFFNIYINDKEYNNNETSWSSKTLNLNKSNNQAISAGGTILQNNGLTPASAIVYITIDGILTSTTTSAQGNWIVPVGNFIDNISDSTLFEILANAGPLGSTTAIVNSTNLQNIPTMVLGKNYDYSNLDINQNNQNLPKSQFTAPQNQEENPISRFETGEIKTNESKLTIDSITDNETVNTDSPEFFGIGPNNTNIQIRVESELQEETITTDQNGQWKWTPPNNLKAGEHTLTLEFNDNGIIKTISKKFIVSAAEGPAFEASSSATPKSTLAPTNKPSPSATASSLPSVPVTGSLTETIGLFIMGIALLFASVFIWNIEYAQRQQ